MVTTFLRMPPNRGDAEDDEAGTNFLLLEILLLSKLSTVAIRLRNTRKGVDMSGGVTSSGKLISNRGGTGETWLTTGAERRAANSGEFLSGVVCLSGVPGPATKSGSVSSDDPFEWGSVESGSAATSSGLRTCIRRLVSGGPGGSSSAVTAVQLSARNLFIIQ